MPLLAHVLPHVELGPVGEREHAHVLAGLHEAVVDVPELGALGLRIPLAEVVPEGEDALLGPGALLVAAGAAERRLESVLLDGVEERHGLEPVARRARARLLHHPAAVDRVLDMGHDQLGVQLGHEPVAVLDHLGEVVARVHVHHRERERPGVEGLTGQVEQHGGVLAAGEEQHAALELRRDLADHVDGLRLEGAEVGDLVGHVVRIPARGGYGCLARAHTCSPHSVFDCPAQRPSRPAPGRVQGAQPIES